ncbi:hypothetical protein [Prosthecochloris sp. HL-130-GSB]|uniref:hypothetical protein n=1 Tax=Prosthecochloris sp. HL-130-GSB TaxID=1974213 RepID=UPI000A1C0851|nr:hypothetical protein [Prosthecochloris sp. HL-130-GSB]ARM31629.1 hypothetical protein B9H02_10390 [Prosthecochloris sp. HL-130-GSB]
MKQKVSHILPFLVCIGLVCVTGRFCLAEEPDSLQLSAGFSPVSVRIGDRIDYYVLVHHASVYQVGFSVPRHGGRDAFSVISQSVSRPSSSVTEFSAELAVFELGDIALPQVDVTVRDSLSGRVHHRKVVAQSTLRVEPFTDTTMKQLLPIRPIREVPFSWNVSVPGGLAVFAVCLLLLFTGLLLWKRYLFRHGEHRGPLDALDELRNVEKGLDQGLDAASCSEQLSFLVRRYLEEMYAIPAFEEVTSEIQQELVSRHVPGAGLFARLLEEADMVKFAESRPSVDDCRESIVMAETAFRASQQAVESKR